MSTVQVEVQKPHELVCGWARNTYSNLIPSDIIDLIVLFYDLVFRWKFSIHDLLADNKGVQTIPTRINSIPLCYSVSLIIPQCTNGMAKTVYSIANKYEFPDNIESIDIEAQFHVISTNFKTVVSGKITRKATSFRIVMEHNILDYEKDEEILMNCAMQIRSIKYKSWANKADYHRKETEALVLCSNGQMIYGLDVGKSSKYQTFVQFWY